MAVSPYKAVKISGGKPDSVEDFLTVEQSLQISLNGNAYTLTMQTPGDEFSLVRGLLYTENVYVNTTVQPDIQVTEKSTQGFISAVNVTVPADQLGKGAETIRNIMSVSSCGLCGKAGLDEVSEVQLICNEVLKAEHVQKMFTEMNSGQNTFIKSGGSHACAAFDINGNLLCMHEDIGRHNAVDKVIGDLLLNNKLPLAKCVTVSGRISYEIVNKCFAAQIPFLAAVSAPSTLAVDFANEKGITLMGFCRENKFTVYSHEERINIGTGVSEKNRELKH
ncbi:MAG: formate dehydrogenase accessory sulfurtransferase FdhD [Bacteroidia bacterium]|nr:formate dehydrogenase accessory sulfurtransferase FdhD [Bacteroidia bacterium]